MTAIPKTPLPKEAKIALCLSGGGLRATFFHLGVIRALRDQSLLRNVTEVYSVSGGSIAAVHLIRNWHLYTHADEQEFDKARQDLIRISKWDLRGCVIRRWILAYCLLVPRLLGYGRTALLQKQYDGFFKSGLISEIYPAEIDPETPPPKIFILATSFTTGHLCSFSDKAYAVEEEDGLVEFPADIIPTSLALAASSAFPPLFPPARLTRSYFDDKTAGNLPSDTTYLTDGGVFDNLGFHKLSLMLATKQSTSNCAILSNGSGAFSRELKKTFSNIVARTARSTDILMRRLGEETIKAALGATTFPVVHASISDSADTSPIPKTVQLQLQSVRTDLDVFSEMEVDLLTCHGREIATQALRQHQFSVVPRPAGGRGNPFSDKIKLDKIVRAAKKRSLGINLKDWATYAIAAYVLLLLCGGYWSYQEWTEHKREQASLQAFRVALKEASNNSVQEDQRIKAKYEEELSDLRAQLAALNQRPLPQPPATNERGAYKVWIQFAGFDREDMVALGKKLADLKWTVPGGDKGGERTPRAAGMAEIRYGPQTDRSFAEQLSEDIAATGLIKKPVRLNQVANIPPGSLEIWISR